MVASNLVCDIGGAQIVNPIFQQLALLALGDAILPENNIQGSLGIGIT